MPRSPATPLKSAVHAHPVSGPSTSSILPLLPLYSLYFLYTPSTSSIIPLLPLYSKPRHPQPPAPHLEAGRNSAGPAWGWRTGVAGCCAVGLCKLCTAAPRRQPCRAAAVCRCHTGLPLPPPSSPHCHGHKGPASSATCVATGGAARPGADQADVAHPRRPQPGRGCMVQGKRGSRGVVGGAAAGRGTLRPPTPPSYRGRISVNEQAETSAGAPPAGWRGDGVGGCGRGCVATTWPIPRAACAALSKLKGASGFS